MSEAEVHEAADDQAENDEAEDQDDADQQQSGGDDEGGEGAEEPKEREVDWKARAHDKEGLAAKERARRRTAEREARELRGRIERLEAAGKRPEGGGASLEDMIASIPDPEEDPVGATVAVTKVLKLFQAQQSSDAEEETKVTAQQSKVRELVQAMDESEAEFAEEHPDYIEAQKHFKAARQAEFEDMGYAGDALKKAMAEDLLGLVQRAVTGGRDPAEVVYNLAKKRGFKAGDGAAKAKLKEIAEASEAGKSPAGARNGGAALSYADVSKLKGAAFDAAFTKLEQQEKAAPGVVNDVIRLRGVQPETDRRAFLLNEFAAAFDRYVADYGAEPDAFVAAFGGIRQPVRLSWTTQGDTEGAASAMLALSVAVLTKELVNPDPS